MNWLDPGFAVVPLGAQRITTIVRRAKVVDPIELEEFGPDRTRSDANALRRAYHRAYYHSTYKAKRRAYYQRTKERDRAKKAAQARARYAKNTEEERRKARDRLRMKYATDPAYRERVLARSAKRRAMLKGTA